jgi:hypothetical protein
VGGTLLNLWEVPRKDREPSGEGVSRTPRYVPPRPLDEIDAEIKALEKEIQDLLGEVTE